MQPISSLLLTVLLAMCHAALDANKGMNHMETHQSFRNVSVLGSTLYSTVIHPLTTFITAPEPSDRVSEPQNHMQKRSSMVPLAEDQLESTIVVTSTPNAWMTILAPAEAGPSGAYGDDSGASMVSASVTNSGIEVDTQSYAPTGAYGQQPSSPTGDLSPSPANGQSPMGQSPYSSGQPYNISTAIPTILTTVVPVMGTIVETIIVSLEAGSTSGSLAMSSSSGIGTLGPISASNTETTPTTLVTSQEGVSLSATGGTVTIWVPLSTSSSSTSSVLSPILPSLPTTFVTISSASGSLPSSATSSCPSGAVTVPGSEGPPSAANSASTTTLDMVTSVTTPVVIVSVPYSTVVGTDMAGPRNATTCTTGIYTNVVTAPTTATTASTSGDPPSASGSLASLDPPIFSDPSVSSDPSFSSDPTSPDPLASLDPPASMDPPASAQLTTLGGDPTAVPIAVTSASVAGAEVNIIMLCWFITLAILAEMTG
ncbi:hypothetical protein GGS20DRAFT_285295 [Poronia punctata]|nr:hypothetical protein GGS20DRAFT_285295 [Poronia punctata]